VLSLGPLAFLSPWLLIALAGLPVLWWLLRITPPAPRLVRFPAIRLLFRLHQKEETPAHTPLWLLLLRLALAALIIVGLAHPLLNPGAALTGSGPLILVVDNGWASAAGWPARQEEMSELLDQAEREQRSVIVLPTAPTEAPIEASKLLRATDAQMLVRAMVPRPWPVDHAGALNAAEAIDVEGSANVVWLSDGLGASQTGALAGRLQRLGSLRVVGDAVPDVPVAVLPPSIEGGRLKVRLARVGSGAPQVVRLQAMGDEGRVVAVREIRFSAQADTAEVFIDLPAELRNRLTRLQIEGRRTAGAAVLIDERWRRRPVGLVAGAGLAGHPLLSEGYYLERALGPFSEVRQGNVETLLQRPLAVLILADNGPLAGGDRTRLADWIQRGGVVVRFAGPRLAESDDDLVPVKLRRGDRSFGGAMSWTRPMALAPFETASPFSGIAVPDDIRIRRQVLAEPSVDLGEKTWARLADGTPLVTAERRGDGWLILVHTTANAEWSNLTLSGLFLEMLHRIVGLSQGVATAEADAALPPLETMDGYGQLEAAPATAAAIPAGRFDDIRVGPAHPPGFYGSETARRALNLTSGMEALQPLASLPEGVSRSIYGGQRETDLKPWLLTAALVLALIDIVIALALRGLLPARAIASGLLLCAVLLPASQGRAQQEQPSDPDSFAIAATEELRLAYVLTGDAATDEISAAALRGLRTVLRTRTSVEPGDSMGVDPARDELMFFPFLYWPVTPEQAPPQQAAVERLNAYIASGGILVFDIRGQPGSLGQPGGNALRRLARDLDVPRLVPVPDDHVLTKAFYLMRQFPGRWTGGAVWVERAGRSARDGVSPVIVSSNDWGSAWAMDQDQRPLFAVVPGGETQREYAYRAGVNVVMYALTGNYKADQVHIPAILERLGQ